MKRLSDYKGEEAIELWADLIDPLTVFFKDEELISAVKGKAPIFIAKEMLKSHKTEALEIMLRIDPTPIDGMTVLMRLAGLLADIGRNKEIMRFFASVEQETSESASSGSAMESTEDGEK